MTLFQIEQEKTSVTINYKLIKPKIYFEIATKFEWSKSKDKKVIRFK